MSGAETQKGTACRPDAANDEGPAVETCESRVAGLKHRFMARIARGIEQTAGRPPAILHMPASHLMAGGQCNERPQPQRIGWRFNRQREATVQTTGEVLIVTSSYKVRALSELQSKDDDVRLSSGRARVDLTGRSESFDANGTREPGGSMPDSRGEGLPLSPPSRPVSSGIGSAMDGAGEGLAASTVEIVLAYLAKNTVDPTHLPKLISDLNKVLWQISEKGLASKEGARPAVPITKSVTPDYVICLEDGRRFKSMKRHLKATYNLTPKQYRDKWGLPESYPMIAPNYAKLCSNRAKSRGFGKNSLRSRL